MGHLFRLMIAFVCAVPALAASSKTWDVAAAGAVGDGVADCTVVFQRLLDEAGAAGGGVVQVPAGRYRINGTLSIPEAVTLEGVFRVPPTDQGGKPLKINGSILLAFAGRGQADSPPFIKLGGCNAAVSGLAILYPEWSQGDVPPVPYPPTIGAADVNDVAVLDCLIVQPYEAIRFDRSARFVVRNVFGSPSFRGLYVDACYDIGRVENCHFWPFGLSYDPKDPFCQWVNTQGVAFEFARTDWQYVTNTFCFGYGVGYKFSETKAGACNGNFLGIGADSCRRGILVEQSQPYGLLITNGEFVGQWGSTDSTGIEIAQGAGAGKVSLNNCAFWGPLDQCLWLRSNETQLTAIGCNFCSWDVGTKGSPAIRLERGKAIVQGNTFGDGDTHVEVGGDVVSAIIMANQAASGLTVDNRAGERTQLVANEAPKKLWTKEEKQYYRVMVGADGDRPFVMGWHGKEGSVEWPDAPGTMRWSTPESRLKLPIVPGTPYTLTLEVSVPPEAIDAGNGVFLDGKKIGELPSTPGLGVVTVRIPRVKADRVVLDVRTKGWQPSVTIPGSSDQRVLGLKLRAVTMRASRAPKTAFDANVH